MTASSSQAKAEIVHERAKTMSRGGDDTHARLERFVRDAVAGGATRLELVQVGTDGSSHVKSLELLSPPDVAHAAFEFARHDAQAFAGVTGYAVLAYSEGSTVYRERCTFRVAARMLNDVAPSESPTAAGLQLQAMRHMEVMAFQYSEGMRNVLREKDITIGHLREDNEKLRGERSMLIESQMDVIKMREELSRDVTEKQIATEREKHALASKDKLHEAFFKYIVPVLAAKLGAWKAAPAAVAPVDEPASADPPPAVVATSAVAEVKPAPRLSAEACESVVDFVTSLDEPTFAKMLGVLSDDQGTKLLALVAQLTADTKGESNA